MFKQRFCPSGARAPASEQATTLTLLPESHLYSLGYTVRYLSTILLFFEESLFQGASSQRFLCARRYPPCTALQRAAPNTSSGYAFRVSMTLVK
jgi:hypothetical protein